MTGETIWDDKENGLLAIIEHAMQNAPRSLQTQIGPSELGVTCTRRLIYKLCTTDPEPDGVSRWKAEVGTAIHARLAQIIEAHNEAESVAQQRFLVETRVGVGYVAGKLIMGSCDLFDIDTGSVVDWKTTSNDKLKRYRRTGPGMQYIVQAQLYARGFALAGQVVKKVLLIFLPRDGELSSTYVWQGDYDEQVALDALARAERLCGIAALVGVKAAADMFEHCADIWCPRCANRPFVRTAVKELSTSSDPTDDPFSLGDLVKKGIRNEIST